MTEDEIEEQIKAKRKADEFGFERVSDVSLWEHMDRLFSESGVELWEKGVIPSQASTNSFIAHANSKIIQTFLEEQSNTHSPKDDGPAYIIELGAGSGRFAYHFLQHFFGDDPQNPYIKNVVYVMNDIARINIDFWKNHPQFQPYVEAGLLDFCKHNVVSDADIMLDISGECLTTKSTQQPIALIANYVFDSIPVDFFAMQDDALAEKLMIISDMDEKAEFKTFIENLRFKWRTHPITMPYYKKPTWDKILERYEAIGGSFQFNLPVGAFKAIENLHRIFSGPMMVMVNDYGHISKESVSRVEAAVLNNNGNITSAVNFDALGCFIENNGGERLSFSGLFTEIASVGYILGSKPENTKKTRAAYQSYIEGFSPDNFMMLQNSWKNKNVEMTLAEAISFIKLAHYNSTSFLICRASFLKACDVAVNTHNILLKETLVVIADSVMRFAYQFEGTYDPSLEVAQMYMKLGHLPKARKALEHGKHHHRKNKGLQILLDRCAKLEQVSAG